MGTPKDAQLTHRGRPRHYANLMRGALTSRLQKPNSGGGARRGVLAIFTGNAVGQGVALLAAPVLSRLYSPSEFGLFAVLTSVTVMLGTIAALRYELAIPLPEREEDAFSLAFVGMWASGAVGVVGMASVALFGDQFAHILGHEGIGPWLWVVPPVASFMGTLLVLGQLAVRQRRYVAWGRRATLQSLFTAGGQVLLGALGLKSGGLFLGYGLGQTLGALSLAHGASLRCPEARSGRRPRSILRIARRYRRFPVFLAPSGLINVLGLSLPVILVAGLYGTSVAGWLALTQRVLTLPVALVGAAIGQVYLGEMSKAWRSNPKRAQALFRNASRSLAVAASLLLAGLLILGPWAFVHVFGAEWVSSGDYARATAVGVAAQLVAAPLSQTLIVLERTRLQFVWDSLRLMLTSGSILFADRVGMTPLSCMWLLGLANALTYVFGWFLSNRSLAEEINRI